MKNSRCLVKVMSSILILMILPIITSCAGDGGPVYRTWIDFPKQGAEFIPGSSIPITIHIADQQDLGEVIIRVGEEIIYKGPPPPSGDPVFAINQEWVPDQPGDYSIEVDVTDNDGITMSRAQVDIHVIGELEALKPDLAITDIQLVGNNMIKCYYENLGAAVLPEGREFWFDIIFGPAESEVPPVLRLNLGSGSILIYGTSYYTPYTFSTVPSWPHLVTCRIDVDGQIDESDEDNNVMTLNLGVNLAAPPLATTVTPTDTQPPPTTQPPPPTTQPPPPPTTQPPPPPDSSPPNISGMSAAPDRIAVLPCGQNTVTISANVSDPSGVAQVKLYYRVAKGSITGSWQVQNMAHSGGNQYQLAVGPPQISASYDPYGGLILQYYVKAWDSHDNTSQTSSGNVPLDHCVQ